MTLPKDFRFTDMMEKGDLAPIRHKQPPLWNPAALAGGIPRGLAAAFATVHVPTVNWAISPTPEDEVPEGTVLTEVDRNGAFVAAGSSATFAHCALEQTGELDLERGTIPPGLMLVDAHVWQGGAPGSPLGPARITTPQIWVPHTVYSLLRDLTHGCTYWPEGGYWPDATVYDSWTADACRFSNWANAIRDTRAAFKRAGDELAGEAIKLAYSQSVQMWNRPPDKKGTPLDQRKKRNKAYRPDWYAALHGQHFANAWRTGFRCALAGRPPLRMWDKDRFLFKEDDFAALLRMPEPPLRRDDTGIDLGHYKWVRYQYAGIEV